MKKLITIIYFQIGVNVIGLIDFHKVIFEANKYAFNLTNKSKYHK